MRAVSTGLGDPAPVVPLARAAGVPVIAMVATVAAAVQAVASGAVDCVLALGFEQMVPGALTTKFDDRPTPFERQMNRN